MVGPIPKKLIPPALMALFARGMRVYQDQRALNPLTPVVLDVDNCLHPSEAKSGGRTPLDPQNGQHPLVLLLRKGVSIIIVSHGPMERVGYRIVDPVRQELEHQDGLAALKNFLVYVDGGVSRYFFTEQGQPYERDRTAYKAHFSIVKQNLEAIEQAFKTGFDVWQSIMRASGNTYKSDWHLGVERLSDFKIEMRQIEGPLAYRVQIVAFAENVLRWMGRADIFNECRLSPSGSSTMHAISHKLSKSFALNDALKILNIPVGMDFPVPCFGDEVLPFSYASKMFWASDSEFLLCPNANLIAVNKDQAAVEMLGNPRLIPGGGAGPEWTYQWLQLIYKAVSKGGL